jgi:hypothetical protein
MANDSVFNEAGERVMTNDQLYFDLFTTALEGGIGYWSSADSYHWANDDDSEDVIGFYAVIVDREADDGKPLRLDRDVMARGYRLATSSEWRNRIGWSCDKPPVVITADTDWDYDAGDADVIAQLGLFGDVIYG